MVFLCLNNYSLVRARLLPDLFEDVLSRDTTTCVSSLPSFSSFASLYGLFSCRATCVPGMESLDYYACGATSFFSSQP